MYVKYARARTTEISMSNHTHHFTFELLYVGLSYCLAFKALSNSGCVETSLNVNINLHHFSYKCYLR